MDVSYTIARNVVRTRYEDLPDEAVAAARREVLDSLGVALAGHSAAGIGELIGLLLEWGGAPQSRVIGRDLRLPAPSAAMVNAAMVHAVDYDDTHEAAVVHPGAVIVPVCFAMADRAGGVSGKDFVTAIALGTDLMCRLGLATKPPGGLLETGWHFTSLYGYFGAAAAAGKMLGLDEDQMRHALGIAYHQCAGNLQCVRDGALTKRMGPGFAARGGITAALMAARGITGAVNCFEGPMGLFKVYHHGGYDPASLTAGLGRTFEGANVGIKPYPCVRSAHPFIDAALDLAIRHDIDPAMIERIAAFGGKGAEYLGEPLDIKRKPRNPVDAQFSIPWVVAVALARRRVSLSDFTDAAIRDDAVLSVAAKVVPQVDESLSRHGIAPGRVEITMRGGEVLVKQVDNARGGPDNPMSFDECVNKFYDCAAYSARSVPKQRLDRLVELAARLEKLENVAEILELLE